MSCWFESHNEASTRPTSLHVAGLPFPRSSSKGFFLKTTYICIFYILNRALLLHGVVFFWKEDVDQLTCFTFGIETNSFGVNKNSDDISLLFISFRSQGLKGQRQWQWLGEVVPGGRRAQAGGLSAHETQPGDQKRHSFLVS